MRKKDDSVGRSGSKNFEQTLRSKQEPDILLMKQSCDAAIQGGGVVLPSTIYSSSTRDIEFIVSTRAGSAFVIGEEEAKKFWASATGARDKSPSSHELILVHHPVYPTLIICGSNPCAAGVLNCLTGSQRPFVLAVPKVPGSAQHGTPKLHLNQIRRARKMTLYWKESKENIYCRTLDELKALVAKPVRMNDVASFQVATDYLLLVDGHYLNSLRPILSPKLCKRLMNKRMEIRIRGGVGIAASLFN